MLSRKNKKCFNGKIFSVYWLIFLNCIYTYPIKIELKHYLAQIDDKIIWENTNQSLKFIEEPIILYFFSATNRDQAVKYKEHQKDIVYDSENFLSKKDCKENNDVLIFQYLGHIKKYNKYDLNNKENIKKENLQIQNYALNLIQDCDDDITILENARKILYSLSIYEIYH